MGDFNSVINNDLDIVSGNPHCTLDVQRFRQTMSRLNVIDVWRVLHADQKAYTWQVNIVLNFHSLLGTGRKGEGGRGYGGGGRGRLYTYRYTVTTRMISALRWGAMRAILMFHNCEGQSHKTVSTDRKF